MNCNNLKNGFNLVNKVDVFTQINNGDWESSRKIIRDNIVDLFKSEPAGKGTGALSSKTIYCVEKVDNEIIFLKRPATLNNGFDFEIHTKVAQFGGRIKNRPRHQDIFDSLIKLKTNNITTFNNVQDVIDEIYICDETNINIFSYDIIIILKLIKWLFIEQDVTYWSFSGREMLYKGLKNI